VAGMFAYRTGVGRISAEACSASMVLAWPGRSADRGANVSIRDGALPESVPGGVHQILRPRTVPLLRGAAGFVVEEHTRSRPLEGAGLSRKDRMIRITRKIEFSAAHFYHNPNFSAEENRRVFGKCNNPHGHGHNYVLEVTIAGEPDPTTGMVLDLKELKDILQAEVMERMDHRHLNYEVPELAGQIPTCENIAALIWKLLEPKIKSGKLDRVRLYESPELFVDVSAGNGARA
jgi:6-pyruvoyltetrahydropterin/6-carboxytetrahydropterin synthase